MAKVNKAKFLTDLQAGKRGELIVGEALKKIFKADSVCYKSSGVEYDLSLIFSDKTERWEVKSDFRAANSGNCFFEYACNGKLSGLSATTAAKWAILIVHLNEIIIFEPQIMFDYLQKSSHRNLQGGDRNAVSGYIVPIDVLKGLSFLEVYNIE